jgi:hypothetical protein
MTINHTRDGKYTNTSIKPLSDFINESENLLVSHFNCNPLKVSMGKQLYVGKQDQEWCLGGIYFV